ncbi:MAG: hypothetical protein QF427_04650, partial [Flavobacteriales bacterium]|nr:hypothetical protein [Flavobacteriales bacterium]
VVAAESQLVQHQLERRGMEEAERRSMALEDQLKAEGDAAKARDFITLGDEFIGGEREYEAVKRSIGG